MAPMPPSNNMRGLIQPPPPGIPAKQNPFYQSADSPGFLFRQIDHRPSFCSVAVWDLTDGLPLDPRIRKRLKERADREISQHAAVISETVKETVPEISCNPPGHAGYKPTNSDVAGLSISGKSASIQSESQESLCLESFEQSLTLSEPMLQTINDRSHEEPTEPRRSGMMNEIPQKRSYDNASAKSESSFFGRFCKFKNDQEHLTETDSSLSSPPSFTRRSPLKSAALPARDDFSMRYPRPFFRNDDKYCCVSKRTLRERSLYARRQERQDSRDRSRSPNRHIGSKRVKRDRSRSRSLDRSSGQRSNKRRSLDRGDGSKLAREESPSSRSPSEDERTIKKGRLSSESGEVEIIEKMSKRTRDSRNKRRSRSICQKIHLGGSSGAPALDPKLVSTEFISTESLHIVAPEINVVVQFPTPKPNRYIPSTLNSLAREIEDRIRREENDLDDVHSVKAAKGSTTLPSLLRDDILVKGVEQSISGSKTCPEDSAQSSSLTSLVRDEISSTSITRPVSGFGQSDCDINTFPGGRDKASAESKNNKVSERLQCNGSVAQEPAQDKAPLLDHGDPDLNLSSHEVDQLLDETMPVSAETGIDRLQPSSKDSSERRFDVNRTPETELPLAGVVDDGPRRKIAKLPTKTVFKIKSHKDQMQDLFRNWTSKLTPDDLQDHVFQVDPDIFLTEIANFQQEYERMTAICGDALHYLEHFLERGGFVQQQLFQRGIGSLFLNHWKSSDDTPDENPVRKAPPECCCAVSISPYEAKELQILLSDPIRSAAAKGVEMCFANESGSSGILERCIRPADRSKFYCPQGELISLCVIHARDLVSHQVCPCGVFGRLDSVADPENSPFGKCYKGHTFHARCFPCCPHTACLVGDADAPRSRPLTGQLVDDS